MVSHEISRSLVISRMRASANFHVTVIKSRTQQTTRSHSPQEMIYLRGTVPSDYAKNQVWDEIKRIDSKFGDLTADFSIQPGTDYTVW
jgi:hypothetical protein